LLRCSAESWTFVGGGTTALTEARHGALSVAGFCAAASAATVLLQINPESRGFLYFVWDGEVVVVA
jgi:hypothetical protein